MIILCKNESIQNEFKSVMTFESIQIHKNPFKRVEKTQNTHKPSKDYFQQDAKDFMHVKSFSAR